MRWGPARGEAVAGRIPPAHLLDLAEIPRARDPPRGHPGQAAAVADQGQPLRVAGAEDDGPAGCCPLLAARATSMVSFWLEAVLLRAERDMSCNGLYLSTEPTRINQCNLPLRAAPQRPIWGDFCGF